MRRSLPLLVPLLGACPTPAPEPPADDDDSAPVEVCRDETPWLTLPVRLHLLRSDIEQLDSTWTEEDFLPVLGTADALWAQACIRFELESAVVAPLSAEQEAEYERAVAEGTDGVERRVMVDAMPRGNRLDPGWNVLVFPTFAPVAPASGIFVFETGDILFAERTPPGAPNPPPILAHEFGHSFGLPHYEGPDPSANLMTREILQVHETAVGLTADQVDAARAQAAQGRPTDESPL